MAEEGYEFDQNLGFKILEGTNPNDSIKSEPYRPTLDR